MSEKEFQSQIIQLAKLCGWLTHHHYDSRRSTPGFPDLVLVHAKRGLLLFVELKTDTGRVTTEQRYWLDSLLAAGQDARLWRPRDWSAIVTILRGYT